MNSKYGLKYRLVTEDDACFILSLRTDPKLARYLHATEADLEKQKQWIREYKKREASQKEFYFIFFNGEEPIGVYRLHDINGDKFSTGSWLFGANAPFGASFLAQIIVREYAFLELGLSYEEDLNGVYLENVNVYKFNLFAGLKEIGRNVDSTGHNISLGLTKDDFLAGRKKILRMLGIKEN